MALTLNGFGLEACMHCKMRSQLQIAGRGDKDHKEVQAFNDASSYLNNRI